MNDKVTMSDDTPGERETMHRSLFSSIRWGTVNVTNYHRLKVTGKNKFQKMGRNAQEARGKLCSMNYILYQPYKDLLDVMSVACLGQALLSSHTVCRDSSVFFLF
jgi:hypothetical protein